MRSYKYLVYYSALFSTMTSCMSEVTEPSGQDTAGLEDQPSNVSTVRESIQGGEETKKYPWSVGIPVTTSTSEGTIRSLCSGTLIASNLVLTARHCIVDYAKELKDSCSGDVDTFRSSNVRTSGLYIDIEPNKSASHPFPVKEILVPGRRYRCDADIALLILDGRIPNDVAWPATPLVWESLENQQAYDSTVSMMGYGATGAYNRDSSGVRRIRKNNKMTCIYGTRRTDVADCNSSSMKKLIWGITYEEDIFFQEGGSCGGDSGGGVFEQRSLETQRPIVLGVANRGSSGSDGSCSDAKYIRTDKFTDFIVEGGIRAAKLGAYAAPLWTKKPIPQAAGSITVNHLWGQCQAALIAPNLVLTAQHCLTNSSAPSIKCGDGSSGRGGYMAPTKPPSGLQVTTDVLSKLRIKPLADYYTVKEVVVPKVENACGSDIALLILNESVPLAQAMPATPFMAFDPRKSIGFSALYTTMRTSKNGWSRAAELVENQNIQCVGGYGVTGPSKNAVGCNGSDVSSLNFLTAWVSGGSSLRTYLDLAKEVHPSEFAGKRSECFEKYSDQGGVAYEQRSVEKATQDFISGRYNEGGAMVYGVMARTVGVSDSSCMGAIYTRLDPHKDWMIETAIRAAKAGGYVSPSWAR